MARKLALAATLLVIALAGGVELTDAAGPAAGTVYHTVHLKSNSLASVTVKCPPGYVAVGGGMSVGRLLAGSGGPLLSSAPSGAGAWTFRLGNPVTGPDMFVTVAVRCVRPRAFRPRGKKLKAKTVSTTTTVQPGQLAQPQVTCPTGEDVTSPGYDERPASSSKRLVASAAAPYPAGLSAYVFSVGFRTTAGWATSEELFVFNPPGGVPVRFRAVARCANFDTAVAQSQVDVPGHSEVQFASRCPRGIALGSGWLTEPDVRGIAGPNRRGKGLASAVYRFFNSSSQPAQVVTENLCLERLALR